MLIVLLACTAPVLDSPAETASDSAAGFVETLAPDQLHILAVGSPAEGDPGHPVAELSASLETRWSIDFDNADGAAGVVREPNGDTTYVRSSLPPLCHSALERVGSDGALIWSQNAYFTGNLSFAHGLVRTPAGDYVIIDTILSRMFAVSEAGEVLWDLSFGHDHVRLPNGLDIQTDADNVTRIVVTELGNTITKDPDHIEVYRLGGRTEVPTVEWTFTGGSGSEDRLWPHGPRFLDDGSVMVNYAARGQIAHFQGGVEDWRVPETPGILAFPRDTLVLPDGSWLVADAAEEVLRVYDPFGSFEVVEAAYVPGVFGLTALECGAGGGLPCLGG
jgi:hypothetical protein